MKDSLTTDEYDALEQISKSTRGARPSACVTRNAKRLSGLKYITYARNGHLTITEKGIQTLFLKSCIDGLRAIAADPLAKLHTDVAVFLGKKGHIVPRTAADGFDITQKGRESLADIDAASS